MKNFILLVNWNFFVHSFFPFVRQVLADQQQVILKGVLEEAIDNNDNEATIKAKTFYKSCMDLRKSDARKANFELFPLTRCSAVHKSEQKADFLSSSMHTKTSEQNKSAA